MREEEKKGSKYNNNNQLNQNIHSSRCTIERNKKKWYRSEKRYLIIPLVLYIVSGTFKNSPNLIVLEKYIV